MKKSILISATIIKGKISGSSWDEKHDSEGSKFRRCEIRLDDKIYIADIYEVIGFSEGNIVLLEFEEKGGQLKVISGINISVNESWGRSPRKLKKYIDPFDPFTLVKGKVTEKRKKKETQLASDETAAGYSMELMIHGKLWIVDFSFGKKVTIGDEVGLIIHGPLQQPLAYRNYTTGRKTGNFPVHYLMLLGFFGLCYGCLQGYLSGRMDLLLSAITIGFTGGILLLLTWFTYDSYLSKKRALELLNK